MKREPRVRYYDHYYLFPHVWEGMTMACYTILCPVRARDLGPFGQIWLFGQFKN